SRWLRLRLKAGIGILRVYGEGKTCHLARSRRRTDELNTTEEHVLRLFPGPAGPAPLHGLYLDERLRPPGMPGRPFVYASFIASLDGRISLPDPDTDIHKPPPAITNPRDWRLLQELATS